MFVVNELCPTVQPAAVLPSAAARTFVVSHAASHFVRDVRPTVWS